MGPTITPPRDARPHTSFVELGVPAELDADLRRLAIVTPTPIQAATLPASLAGRDVLGQGQTGSGKTLAFGIPTVVTLARSATKRRPGRPRALILVPTRELATQVARTIAPLAQIKGLRTTTVFGGTPQGRQVTALRAGVDVLIACPGRLEDLIRQRHCALDDVLVTVLDEADHLADLGFLPAVKRLLDATPTTAQRLLFSATLDATVDALVRRYLRDPHVSRVEPEPDSEGTVTHQLFEVATADKLAVIREIAAGSQRCLLFARTKRGAKKLAGQLSASGLPALELHGNLSQSVRQRNLDAFSNGNVKVLVATDIAARGLHVDDIALVVHVDPPAEHKAYVHRSGRTARAGADGTVITLMTPDQTREVQKLTRAAGISATTDRVSTGHPLLTGRGSGTPTAMAVLPARRPRPTAGRNRRPRQSHSNARA